ncbi:MAG: hypothetical protein HQK70_13900, partial [Desulfamplus sp.]|nr:hypothetical protein [Desulfamplus sp.]
ETSGILTYTAPSEVGTYYITVFDSSGNSSKAEVVVRGGAKRTKIKKTDIFEIANPSPTPNSETQPVAVGNVQKGEKTFALAFDFPNYKDTKGKVAGEPVPMNFYVAAFIPDWNVLIFFDENGGISDINNIASCMSQMSNAVYTESLKFDYCNLDSPLKMDMYILAVESKYDINNNLSFQPADAPFELWHYSFSLLKCQ